LKYVFIGGGNMGRAMAEALIQRQVCAPAEILVVEPSAEARDTMGGLGCQVMDSTGEVIGTAPAVVLAVKPQTAPEAFDQIRPWLQDGQVVISIMAGITMAALTSGLAHAAVVRVMPNTPAQVGLGMNVYFPAPDLPPPALTQVEALLNASGEALRVDSEDAIDAATAVSGSGPAYVFYMAEHWMAQAEALGFSTDQARTLVQQTITGATELWKHLSTPVSTLRQQVTSKGGTTAAALEHFEQQHISRAFREGIEKAYLRAKELGK